LYGCPRFQLDTGEGKLITVLNTGAEISLMPEGKFEDLFSEGFKSTAITRSQRKFDKCFWKINKENKETSLD
jgi:hypothetical protein